MPTQSQRLAAVLAMLDERQRRASAELAETAQRSQDDYGAGRLYARARHDEAQAALLQAMELAAGGAS